jgi:general secretion pathway protein D
MRSLRRGALAAALALALAAPAPAQEREARSVPVEFVRAQLADVVRQIAAAVGRPYLYDPEALRGTVSILGGGPVSPGEAIEILEAALLVRGYSSVPTPGGPRKIIAIDAFGAEAPWRTEPLRERDEAVTTLVRLREVGADFAAGMIRPWIGPTTVVVPYPPANSLILAGSEDRLRHLLLLIGALDQDTGRQLLVRRLRHRGADEVLALVEETFGEAAGGAGPLAAWSDPRTNVLIAHATPARLAELRRFLEEVDRAPRGRGRLRLVPVRHADPEKLAELLQGLASSGAPARRDADEDGAGGAALRGLTFSVTVDPPTKTLIVQADPETADLVTEIAAELDREPPRVALEAVVFEVTSSDSLRLGIDLLGSTAFGSEAALVGGLQSVPGPTDDFLGRVTKSVLIPLVDASGNVVQTAITTDGATLVASAGAVETQILSRPHLVMTSGDEHEIFVGDNVPIPTAQAGPAAGDIGELEIRQNIERQDVGVRVRVRPQVGESGALRLELDLDTTEVVASLSGRSAQEVGPTLRQRRVTTTARLREGEVLVVGFASRPTFERSTSGIPFLSAIPVLGNFFRVDSTQRLASHLVVALQASLLRSRADDIELSIRRRLGLERELARVGPLAARSDAPFALLVTTRSLESDARAIAEGLGQGAWPGEVVAWEQGGERRYDVYLTGFASLAEVAAAIGPVQAAGWTPELVVIPRPAE